MEIQAMENNLFKDMPEAPTPPKLPKYFPDLQGENRGRTPHAGWYQNDLLPWIQNQDLKKLLGYGIGISLLAGKLLKFKLFFYLFFPKFLILLSVTAVLLGLGIHKYQDQIQELGSQATQPIKDAFGVLALHLGEAKDRILVCLDDLKEKIMSLPLPFSGTADDQETGASTSGTSTSSIADDQDTGASTSGTSIVDKIKDFVPYFGNNETDSEEL